MRTVLIAGLAFLPLAHAAASDRSDVLATIHQFVDNSNKGDLQAAATLCTANAAVIDDFPPHAWLGNNGCTKWASSLAAFSKAHGITGAVLTTSQPRHIDVSRDLAYVVLPVQYTYTENSQKMVETGSVWTLVLKKTGSSWRIVAWAWAE